MLSGNHGAVPTHPAAFEKWLFGRWIDPTVISAPGDYTVTANEISDGGTYSGGPYLYRVPIDGDPNRFLTIEGRWFDADGNSGTRWAQANGRESGLLIVEFNLAQDWFSSSPQIYRYDPVRASGTPAASLRAFRPGDRFYRCYATSCVTIEPTSAPGSTFSFSVRLASLVIVPSVAGATQAAATTTLTTAGLALGSVSTASSTTVAAGLVISQNPGSGTQVASGSAVNLVVSSGPPLVTVPSRRGRPRRPGAFRRGRRRGTSTAIRDRPSR